MYPSLTPTKGRRREETPWHRSMALVALLCITSWYFLWPDSRRLNSDGQQRRHLEVKQAMQHAWSNYEQHAFGADELLPLSGKPDWRVWGNVSATLVDALDTLVVMKMDAEFDRARAWVAANLSPDVNAKSVNVFETNIRLVGGLLGAFELSRDQMFLHKAVWFMDTLVLPAIDPETGLTVNELPLLGQDNDNDEIQYVQPGSLAEAGTLQLELLRLYQLTGNQTYLRRVEAFYSTMARAPHFHGVFPLDLTHLWPPSNDNSAKHKSLDSATFGFGGRGDSFYETLLKVYLQNRKSGAWTHVREMYDRAMQGMIDHFVYTSEDGYTYVDSITEEPVSIRTYGQTIRLSARRLAEARDLKMQHLTCFLPGLLALGAESDINPARARAHVDLAKDIMRTCVHMYLNLARGLSSEEVYFDPLGKMDPGGMTLYSLRPEVFESLFVLYRTTQDDQYREWGYELFRNLERETKTAFGYASTRNLNNPKVGVAHLDKMESFFFAETLKYCYLLLEPATEHVVQDLEDFVLNTEGHFIRRVRLTTSPVDFFGFLNRLDHRSDPESL